MYHEVTTKDRRRRIRVRAIVAAALVLIVVVLALGANALQAGTREQGAAAVRRAIMDAAVRCCAIEGSYPLSLKHLEEDYGLRINHDDYIITYEAFASNMAPSVVVVPR